MLRDVLKEKISNCEITIEELNDIVKGKEKCSFYVDDLIEVAKIVFYKRKNNEIDAEYFYAIIKALYKINQDVYYGSSSLSKNTIFIRNLIGYRLEIAIHWLFSVSLLEGEEDVPSDIDEQLEKIDYLRQLSREYGYRLKARICKKRGILTSYSILLIDNENKRFFEFEKTEYRGEKVRFYFKHIRLFNKTYKKKKEKLVKNGYKEMH